MQYNEALKILGISKGAEITPGLLKKTHRNLMKKWHPDLGGCEETSKDINKAVEVVNDTIFYKYFHESDVTDITTKGELIKKLMEKMTEDDEKLTFDDYWITKDQRILKISEMHVNHLKNAIKFLERKPFQDMRSLRRNRKYKNMKKALNKINQPITIKDNGNGGLSINFGGK